MVFSLMSTPPKYDTNVSLSSMKEQGYEYWCMKHRTKHPVPTVSDSMQYENVCQRLIGNTIYWYFSDVVDASLPDLGGRRVNHSKPLSSRHRFARGESAPIQASGTSDLSTAYVPLWLTATAAALFAHETAL